MANPTTTSPFPMLAGKQYMNLTTYRKTGVAVPTPVWFAEDNGSLFVTTLAKAGKVKRLRHTPRVEIAPCTASGKITGDSMTAQAQIVSDAARAEHGRKLLQRKYGLQLRLIVLVRRVFAGIKPGDWVVLEVTPQTA